MEVLDQIGTAIRTFMDMFGVAVVVPFVIFIISVLMRVDPKKALQSALYMAVGLTLFMTIVGILWGGIAPYVTAMSATVGITKPYMDVGWQGAAVIVYASQLGYLYLLLGIGLNLAAFSVKWTDTFQPTDIWNFYQFVFFAIIVQFVTGSLLWAAVAAAFMNLIVLLIADIVAPALQEYYGYENVTITSVPGAQFPAAMIARWIFAKIKWSDRDVRAGGLTERLGFAGEPLVIGLVVGAILGILGSIQLIHEPAQWSKILGLMFLVAGVMVLYPAVAGLFVKGLIPLSQMMQKRVRSGASGRRYFNVSMDPAVYFGEQRNLVVGLILIPIVFFISLVTPANHILMLADIPAMPFMTVAFVVAFRGNILKAVVAGAIWFSFANILNSDLSGTFTQAALAAGVADMVPGMADHIAAGLGVASWTVGTNPVLWVVYRLFSLEGELRYVGALVGVAAYLGVWYHFRTHRFAWWRACGASQEFLQEKYGTENGAVGPAAVT